jgi:hypothetical protein
MTTTAIPPALRWRQRVFDLNEARRAAAYLAPIVREAHEAYRTIMECRGSLAAGATFPSPSELDERRSDALSRLDAASDECNAVGVDLIDLRRGLVRFPALVGGRAASLMWSVGDSIDDLWPELGV